MTAEATLVREAGETKLNTPAAITASQIPVLQLPDGRAAVYEGLNAIASGDPAGWRTEGVFTLQKTASIAILNGGKVYWDRSANKAHFRPASGDFFVGTCVKDAAAAATTVDVELNVKPNYLIDFDGSPGDTLWTHTETLGLGVTDATPDARCKLAFDAQAEVAVAAIYPAETRKHAPLADGPILEMKLAIYDIGDNAALDINFGLVNETHATDCDSITEAVLFHLDGTDLSLLAESDDGTTEVAAADTTVDAVDDTEFEVWIDARNPADVQLYIDGVNVLAATTFVLTDATGPLFPLVHVEKTSDDTTTDVRVTFIRMRTTDFAITA